jgi:hypothetical protein
LKIIAYNDDEGMVLELGLVKLPGERVNPAK